MTFTTKPVQDPIPIWWGGMGPQNQRRAAERGLNLIAPFNAGLRRCTSRRAGATRPTTRSR